MSLHWCCNWFRLNLLQQAISEPSINTIAYRPSTLHCDFEYKYTVRTRRPSSNPLSLSAAVTGGPWMGRMCDTHIDMSVKDKELEDERVTVLPHNDRWWIPQTDSLTSESAFPLFSFVHSVVTLALKFHTGIWCEQRPATSTMEIHNQGSSCV